MPEYLFHNKETNEEWLESMGISQAEEFLNSNPHIERLVHGAPRIGYRSGTSLKPDSDFNDLLKHIKKGNKGSTINTF